ncbi:MAG: tetratricopeptide repeat protein [Flavobacteriaceae bacterium]|nr:tetratricopeptide repeat protein [Flavobacteriaceae bacterium]
MKNKLFLLFTVLFLFNAEAQNTSALPSDPTSALAIADSLYNLGDYSKAINYYNQLSENENIDYKLAKSHEAIGNIPKAIQYYKKAVFSNPKATQATYNYAKLLFKTAKLIEADSIFKSLSIENPNNPNFTYQRGLIKERQKDSTAVSFFQETYKIDSNHINAAYKIAKLKLKKRKFSEAKPYINKGLFVDSASIRFLMLKALHSYHTKNYHQAIKDYNSLLKLGKKDAKLHFNLADSYYKVLDIEKAIDQYTILINEFDDKNEVYHYNLGICYSALHYNVKAIKQFESAIVYKYTPLDKEFYAIARAYKYEGNTKQEIKMLKKAISQNPNDEMLQYQLLLAYDRFYKDKKVVLAYFEKYLKRFGETGKFRELAKYRISELKKEIHFEY